MRRRLRSLVELFAWPLDGLFTTDGLRRLVSEAMSEITDLASRLAIDARLSRCERPRHRMMLPLRSAKIDLQEAELDGPEEPYLLGRVLRAAIHRASDRFLLEVVASGVPSGAQYRLG